MMLVRYIFSDSVSFLKNNTKSVFNASLATEKPPTANKNKVNVGHCVTNTTLVFGSTK